MTTLSAARPAPTLRRDVQLATRQRAAHPAATFGGRAEIMSVMPKNMSHGGTYVGAAHDGADIARTVDPFEGALDAALEARAHGR